jgi:hypothetical protein
MYSGLVRPLSSTFKHFILSFLIFLLVSRFITSHICFVLFFE